MSGGLNEILAEPISEENERIVNDLVKRKMKGVASLSVRLLQAMEERFGPEAREVVRDMTANQKRKPREETGSPAADLQDFCSNLDNACIGSHEWLRVVDEPDKIGYNYTRCLWAEVYRELGEPDLGYVICAGDEPAVEAHNPQLSFERTKTLMRGDELCDHLFRIR